MDPGSRLSAVRISSLIMRVKDGSIALTKKLGRKGVKAEGHSFTSVLIDVRTTYWISLLSW